MDPSSVNSSTAPGTPWLCLANLRTLVNSREEDGEQEMESYHRGAGEMETPASWGSFLGGVLDFGEEFPIFDLEARSNLEEVVLMRAPIWHGTPQLLQENSTLATLILGRATWKMKVWFVMTIGARRERIRELLAKWVVVRVGLRVGSRRKIVHDTNWWYTLFVR